MPNRHDHHHCRGRREPEPKPARDVLIARGQQGHHCASDADGDGSNDRLLWGHASPPPFGRQRTREPCPAVLQGVWAREDAGPPRHAVLKQPVNRSSSNSRVARTVGVSSPPSRSDSGCTPSSHTFVRPFASTCFASSPSESLCVDICGKRAAISSEFSSTTDPGDPPNSTASRKTTWSNARQPHGRSATPASCRR